MKNEDRREILKAHSIGPKVVDWLAAAGYQELKDFMDETPENISFRVEIATGNRPNKNAKAAYSNLIAYARAQAGIGI